MSLPFWRAASSLCGQCFARVSPTQAVKKPIKKVAKKPVKKVVKKVVKKAPVRRGSAGVNNAARGGGKGEVNKVLSFAGDAFGGYGGGNGAAAAGNPLIVGGVVAWVLVLLRYVLFYGAFE